MNLATIIARNEEIMASDMDNEIVMMNIETGKYYNLGKTGSAIWGVLEKPMSVGELIEKLVALYDISREQCEKDTLPFLTKLVENALILEQKND